MHCHHGGFSHRKRFHSTAEQDHRNWSTAVGTVLPLANLNRHRSMEPHVSERSPLSMADFLHCRRLSVGISTKLSANLRMEAAITVRFASYD